MYCGTEFHFLHAHPVSLIFVNGYPSVCHKSGEYSYKISDSDEMPWLMAVTEEVANVCTDL